MSLTSWPVITACSLIGATALGLAAVALLPPRRPNRLERLLADFDQETAAIRTQERSDERGRS